MSDSYCSFCGCGNLEKHGTTCVVLTAGVAPKFITSSMAREAYSLTPKMREELRAIRLFHWQAAMSARRSQRSCEAIMSEPGASEAGAKYDALAGYHIRAVQTLNDFFGVGDTAEGDAAKAKS